MDRFTGRLRTPAATPTDIDFYLRLCAVSWCFQWFRAEKEKISVQFDDCPFRCPKDEPEWKESRTVQCEECPQRKAIDKFFEDAQAVFQERFREELTRPQFEKWFSTMKRIAAFEGSDEDIGVMHSHLLTGFLSEKDKYQRATRPKR